MFGLRGHEPMCGCLRPIGKLLAVASQAFARSHDGGRARQHADGPTLLLLGRSGTQSPRAAKGLARPADAGVQRLLERARDRPRRAHTRPRLC
eukprot:scaffold47972_cov55-Phaeocystis_antarctica.AAC.2